MTATMIAMMRCEHKRRMKSEAISKPHDEGIIELKLSVSVYAVEYEAEFQ